ncbi:MAG TPA: hypothetical protein VM509_13050 [Planctomycetota bacterium]|nr:hypothetical protein [Planctomycetota bacterium]
MSCTLLLVASTRSALPIWGGLLDGVLAFAVVGTAAWIWAIAPKTRDPWALSVGHAAAAFIPALVLAAVWYFRESLDLNVLLPGLAWRTFIVLYSVPAALGAWRPRATL